MVKVHHQVHLINHYQIVSIWKVSNGFFYQHDTPKVAIIDMLRESKRLP